jgi:hypothetical protein
MRVWNRPIRSRAETRAGPVAAIATTIEVAIALVAVVNDRVK